MAQEAFSTDNQEGNLASTVRQASVAQLDPTVCPQWRELIGRKPIDLFHSPRWMNVISESFDVGFHGVALERSGNPEAAVAWVELDDMFGHRRVTLPYCDYADMIASTQEDRSTLMQEAMSAGVPWTLRSHDSDLSDETDWDVSTREFAHHVIDVTPDEDDLFASLSSMARRNTRKAVKAGVEVFEGTTKDHLRSWVDLHIGLRRNKYGMLAQPFSFFENIWDEFIAKGDGFLLLAKRDGEIIAGTVYLVSGNTCFYKFNASSAESLGSRPNNALMWHGMLKARERGLSHVDLGRTSATQQGLKDFKASYGGVESAMTEYRFTPPGYSPERTDEENREVITQVTDLLTAPSVPDSALEEASKVLYRYFG